MDTMKISKDRFEDWVSRLISDKRVFGIQQRDDKPDRYEFKPLKLPGNLRLDYDVAIQAPKKYFQPPSEQLLVFDSQQHYQSVLNDEEFYILGVHPYDMHAINQNDKLFSQGHYDVHYFARREAATIIACDVVNASGDVFAASMGTAVVEEGFDILLTDTGSFYVMEVATEKGRRAAKLSPHIQKADDGDIATREKVWEVNKRRLNKHRLKCTVGHLPKMLSRAYDHPVWEEKARTCFGCGSCTQVCPTCYCFNVKDDFNWDLESGKRQREWDSCQLKGFTKVAGEFEFRRKRSQRFRHRFYRKGQYIPEKIGQVACIGCGRCVSACLPDIANPVNVYNRLVDDLGIG